MEDRLPRPNLASLPLELLLEIIDDPTRGEGITLSPSPTHWLAIGHKPDESLSGMPYNTAPSLRALSQVCRRLRQVALPILWSVAHVDTIDELGRLRQMLRLSPSYATYVRSFLFRWNPNWLIFERPTFRIVGGTGLPTLALAFRDRAAAFMELAKIWGEEDFEIKREVKKSWQGVWKAKAFFEHEGEKYFQPGCPPRIQGGRIDAVSGYDWDAPKLGEVSGPDGKGPDRLIKNAKELNECLVEIIGKLTSLETFGWYAPLVRMPVGVFKALLKLTTLKRFHPGLSDYDGEINPLPFWQIARGVEELSLDVRPHSGYDYHDESDDEVSDDEYELVSDPEEVLSRADYGPRRLDNSVEWELPEQRVTTFTMLELPKKPPKRRSEKATLHYNLAVRTFIAAAKGGRLKHFYYDGNFPHPFAIRSLVPYWVTAESMVGEPEELGWEDAATFVRPLFAHASLWLDTPVSATEPREDRKLTQQQVQSLRSYFELQGLPMLVRYLDRGDEMTESDGREEPVRRYLPWLEQDKELAQRAADSWNAVVQRGEANKVRCYCPRCRSIVDMSWAA